MALDLVPLLREKTIRVGEPFRLQFRVLDVPTQTPRNGLEDLRVLVFLAPGTWQMREGVRPIHDGTYEVAFDIPRSGVYYVFFECPALDIGYHQLPHLVLQATDAEAAPYQAVPPRRDETFRPRLVGQ
jgi:hypothetical protein